MQHRCVVNKGDGPRGGWIGMGVVVRQDLGTLENCGSCGTVMGVDLLPWCEFLSDRCNLLVGSLIPFAWLAPFPECRSSPQPSAHQYGKIELFIRRKIVINSI
jgi:hypothetical protein